MTTVNGMPITPELADFLKSYCPHEKGDHTFLTAAIETMSDIQDFVTTKLGEMDEKEKCQVANYLTDIVVLKKDLIKLSKLLPIVEGRGGSC